MNIESSRQQ